MARVERLSVVKVAVLEVAPGAGSKVAQRHGAVGGSICARCSNSRPDGQVTMLPLPFGSAVLSPAPDAPAPTDTAVIAAVPAAEPLVNEHGHARAA